MPVREEIVTGPCEAKAKLVQKWLEELTHEHIAGAIDYYNPYRSEHLIAAKQAQIFFWISAMLSYEL